MALKKHLPLFLQQEQAECGLACIAMLAAYHGHRLDLVALRKRVVTSGKGMSLLSLRNLCWSLNLHAHALRLELSELKQVKLPCILHWNLNHFVVLKRLSGKKAWIYDPASGKQVCSLETVSRAFTGVVLEVEAQAGFKKLNLGQPLRMRDFIKGISGFKQTMGLLVSVALLLEFAELMPILFTQYITDTILGSQNLFNLYALLSGGAFCLFALAFFRYLKGRALASTAIKFKAQFCTEGMKHLMQLPLDYFQRRTQGQIQMVFQAMETVQKKLCSELVETSVDLGVLVIHASVMALYSLGLSLVVWGSLLLLLATRYTSFQTLKGAHQACLNERSEMNTHFLESIQGMLPIQCYDKALDRWAQWRNIWIAVLNQEQVTTKLELFYQLVGRILKDGEHLLLLGIGAYLIHIERLSLGMFIAFLAYRQAFVSKATSLLGSVFDYRLMAVEVGRIQDMLSEPPLPLLQAESSRDLVKGALAVQDLAFRFSEQSAFLFEGLSLKVEAGEKLVIVGPSGMGKTTLLKIMMGLLKPSGGQIYFDEVLLDDSNLKTYRQHIASVMQADHLFSGSIVDNIVFFEQHVDEAWLDEVCELTSLTSVIAKLPMRYHTHLGMQGHLLSGGQKQRLLLARALYKKPSILFLDEATSHLDVGLEKALNTALKRLSMTQITIAHRKETIAMADRIFDLAQVA